jgi:hypothetical protein
VLSFFFEIDVDSCVPWAIETQFLKIFSIGED